MEKPWFPVQKLIFEIVFHIYGSLKEGNWCVCVYVHICPSNFLFYVKFPGAVASTIFAWGHV